jgi:hypothetical protein
LGVIDRFLLPTTGFIAFAKIGASVVIVTEANTPH